MKIPHKNIFLSALALTAGAILTSFLLHRSFPVTEKKTPVKIGALDALEDLTLEDLTALNQGAVEITYDQDTALPNGIKGNFTPQPITSKEDAVKALLGVRTLLQITGSDFYCSRVSQDGDYTVYTIVQLYHAIPVEAGRFTITAADNGEALSVIGSCCRDLDLNTAPRLTAAEGKKQIQLSSNNRVKSAELVIYSSKDTDPALRLCWKYTILSLDGLKKRTAYIDARTGEQVDLFTTIYGGQD